MRRPMTSLHRSLPVDAPYQLLESWRLVPLGRHDPSVRRVSSELGWATHTPEGPATVRMAPHPSRVELTAWGPGAAWLLERAPAFTGLAHAPPALADSEPMRRLARAGASCRLVCLPNLFESLVRVILQQKITFGEACRGWGLLVHQLGTEAPGPLGLRLPPHPTQVARAPGHLFTRMGIQRPMVETIREVAVRYRAIERAAATKTPEALGTLLQRIRGVGPWTTGMVLGLYRAHGDAVILADYHLPHTVAFALTGAPRGSDDRMLDLLEPYRPHRMWVVRWIHAARIQAPRRGPRMAAQPLPGARR